MIKLSKSSAGGAQSRQVLGGSGVQVGPRWAAMTPTTETNGPGHLRCHIFDVSAECDSG